MSATGFSATETRAVASLASLYLVRMLGLFMLFPVMSVYARDYPDASPVLIGVALGIYGLAQACLQLPLGMLSDRIGRRRVVVGSQMVFLLGSVVGALATSIWGIILGRLLQGAGAVASTLMALVADVTRDQNRSKAMAAVGASIGVSFALSLVLGPVVTGVAGLPGLFWMITVLAALGLFIALRVVPYPVAPTAHRAAPSRALLSQVLRNPQLLRLDAGVGLLHFVITASFIAVPRVFADELGIPRESHGVLYGWLLGGTFVAMLPLMVLAERRRRAREVFLLSIAMILGGMALLTAWRHGEAHVFTALALYFLALNYLEAALPSLVSRATLPGNRGTASGVYSTCQFLGAFLGGVGGGYALQHGGITAVFGLCTALVACWLFIAVGMDAPQHLRAITLAVDASAHSVEELSSRLNGLPGVREVLVVAGESIAYLQVDGDFDASHLYGLPVRHV